MYRPPGYAAPPPIPTFQRQQATPNDGSYAPINPNRPPAAGIPGSTYVPDWQPPLAYPDWDQPVNDTPASVLPIQLPAPPTGGYEDAQPIPPGHPAYLTPSLAPLDDPNYALAAWAHPRVVKVY